MDNSKHLEYLVGALASIAICISIWKIGDAFDLSKSDWAAWVQAVGSIAAIGVAIWVSDRQHKESRRRDREREDEEVQNMLLSIRDELEVLWAAFEDKVGKQLCQSAPKTAFLITWPAPDKPFTVYDGCKHKIGKIPNPAIRRLIVVTYAQAEGLLISFRMNNDLLAKYENAEHLRKVTANVAYSVAASRTMYALESYGDGLRSTYNDVKLCLTHLLKLLPKVEIDI